MPQTITVQELAEEDAALAKTLVGVKYAVPEGYVEVPVPPESVDEEWRNYVRITKAPVKSSRPSYRAFCPFCKKHMRAGTVALGKHTRTCQPLLTRQARVLALSKGVYAPVQGQRGSVATQEQIDAILVENVSSLIALFSYAYPGGQCIPEYMKLFLQLISTHSPTAKMDLEHSSDLEEVRLPQIVEVVDACGDGLSSDMPYTLTMDIIRSKETGIRILSICALQKGKEAIHHVEMIQTIASSANTLVKTLKKSIESLPSPPVAIVTGKWSSMDIAGELFPERNPVVFHVKSLVAGLDSLLKELLDDKRFASIISDCKTYTDSFMSDWKDLEKVHQRRKKDGKTTQRIPPYDGDRLRRTVSALACLLECSEDLMVVMAERLGAKISAALNGQASNPRKRSRSESDDENGTSGHTAEKLNGDEEFWLRAADLMAIIKPAEDLVASLDATKEMRLSDAFFQFIQMGQEMLRHTRESRFLSGSFGLVDKALKRVFEEYLDNEAVLLTVFFDLRYEDVHFDDEATKVILKALFDFFSSRPGISKPGVEHTAEILKDRQLYTRDPDFMAAANALFTIAPQTTASERGISGIVNLRLPASVCGTPEKLTMVTKANKYAANHEEEIVHNTRDMFHLRRDPDDDDEELYPAPTIFKYMEVKDDDPEADGYHVRDYAYNLEFPVTIYRSEEVVLEEPESKFVPDGSLFETKVSSYFVDAKLPHLIL